MTVSLPQTKKVLSLAEEAKLDESLDYLKSVREGEEAGGIQGVNHQVQDRKALEARIAELERVKESMGAQEVTGTEREAFLKEQKSLEEKLNPGMTWEEYSKTKPQDGIRYRNLVHQIGRWNSDQNRHRLIERWRYVSRSLNPTDPEATNTMRLFTGNR